MSNISLLDKFNNTYRKIDYSIGIIQQFEAIVSKYPNNKAVQFKDEFLNYKELNEQANLYARELLALGVSAESRVAIYLDECMEMISMLLAVLKTGASYIPLPEIFPSERVIGIIKDAECKALITNSSLALSIKDKVSCSILEIEKALNQTDSNNVGIYHKLSDCVYNIFTSGSTGKPKGVSISHANLINFNQACIDYCSLSNTDNGFKYAGYGFDASICEIYPIITIGGTLHIIDKELKLDIVALNQYLEQHKITYGFLPTQFCEVFNTEVTNNSLRYLLTGGDKLRKIKLRNYQLINMYGPTEITVAATFFTVDREDYQNIPIGSAAPNYTTYIVNEHMQRVAVGEIGELCIGGDGIGIGYINLPELTMEKFVKNPFVTTEDLHLGRNLVIYKTGDLARYLVDGNIEFLGRNDFQVKIRGFRIELGEIEQHLLKYPEIMDCLVTAASDPSGNTYLYAYYISKVPLSIAAIQANLSKFVPEYMVPALFVHMTKFPINANGKVDRKALPAPDLSQLITEYLAPQSREEELVCKAFAEVLELNRVGINDGFITLGGNSIRAIKLVALLQKYFTLTINDIFTLKSPQEIAKLPKAQTIIQINQTAPQEFYPTSYAQERMFVTNQVGGCNTLYNIPIRLKIVDSIDRGQLGLAIDQLFQRHSVLRTNFKVIDGKVKQYIYEPHELVKEFQKATEIEINQSFNDFIRPFDLENDALMRVKLVKVNEKLHYLFLDFHHIAFDGGSIYPLISDLKKLYQGESLPELAINYVDFAVWQREGQGQELVRTEQEYWHNRFGTIDIEPLNLPLDYPRLVVNKADGKTIRATISGAEYRELKDLSHQLQVSLNSICFAAYAVLWYRYTNQKDIIVGSTISGRNQPEVDNLIGMFVNTVPVVTHVEGGLTLAEVIKKTQEDWLNLISNQNYQMEDLISYLRLHAESGRNPLFDVVFNYLEGQPRIDNFILDSHGYTENEAKFDLLLNVENHEDFLDIAINYKTALFSEQTILTILSAYLNICKTMAANLHGLVKDVAILSDADLRKIIHEFNQTKYEYDQSRTYFDNYLDVVKRYANKTALIFAEETITFAQLDSLATNYARKIIDLGFNHGDFIAILAEPSFERIALILACHYAGVGYVPLLSEMPLDRLQFIVDDCDAKILATTGFEAKTNYKLIEDVLSSAPNTKLMIAEFDIELLNSPKKIDRRALPNDVAYIIYTSGTTGNPKGSPISHFSLNNYLIWHADYFKITNEDICVQFAGFSFDAAVIDIYLPLKLGSSMCIVPNQIRKDLNQLTTYLSNWKCTVSFFPTKLGELMMDAMPAALRCLVLGGEELKKTFKDDKVKLGNICAPSECTVAVVGTYIEPGCKNITMGYPIYNSRSYVLDENLQPVPVGVPGEWYIAGYGVSTGYIKRPELTQEKFLANPFIDSAEPDAQLYSKIYKTGDMVCWTADGKLKYLGRKDFQVKIRGYRIEIEDIEFHLHNYTSINGVIVLALEDKTSKFLCAYYGAKSEIDSQLLREHLGKAIPEYMIPDYFVWLNEFPMTVNGKIDRRALPRPDLSSMASEYVMPSSEAEKLICEQIAEILEVERIGLLDDFFKLGGNSIKAIRLVSKLQDNFKVNVSDLFKLRTAGEMAANLPFVKDNLRQRLEQIKLSLREQVTDPTEAVAFNAKRRNYLSSLSMIEFQPGKKPIRGVLLTGGTGYLGCNILAQLLNETPYIIYLIVRAKDDDDAFKRINYKFKFYFDHELSSYPNRVKAFAANIEAPQLGFATEIYAQLIKEVDSIIHSAALVKHYGDYQEFYSANVQATINLLEFAKLTQGKDFNYVSTESVLRDGYDPQHKFYLFDESDEGSNLISRSNVYVQTKYEGEVVTREYRGQGITTNIFRVGNLSMNSSNYRNQENIEDNGFFTRVKTMLNLGVIAKEVALHEVSPVDKTALAIVKLFEQKALLNQTYHVFNPNLCDLSELLFKDNYLAVREVTISEFIDQFLAKINLSSYRKYIELFMLHEGWLQELSAEMHTKVELLQDRTSSILAKLGFTWPQITLEMLSNIVQKAFKERLSIIESSNIGKYLNQENLLSFAKSMQLYHYPSDSFIDKEQVVNPNLKFIIDGFVDNYIKSPGGWVSSIQLLSTGDTINLESIINYPSLATYKATFDSVSTIEISQNTVAKLFNNDTSLFKSVLLQLLVDKNTIQQMYACLK